MELWDLYTENRVKTGQVHPRGKPLPENTYHLVINVWIKNSEGKYLISRRSKTKSKNPLKFETVAGAALAGENSFQAAVRETKEEVGLDLDPKKTKLIYSATLKSLQSISDVYLFNYDGAVDLRNATTDEVESAGFMTVDEIKFLFEERLFVRTLDYCFSKVFSL